MLGVAMGSLPFEHPTVNQHRNLLCLSQNGYGQEEEERGGEQEEDEEGKEGEQEEEEE